MKVRDVRWCIMLLVAVCVGTAAAEDGGRSAPAVFEGDPRLLKSVSLQEHRIYLGDLLERVRSATGVRLGVADQPDAVSGFLVTAVVHDRPAWELLDALAGLYSTRQDRWYWRRSGNRKAPVYRLEYPRPWAARVAYREALAERSLVAAFHKLQRFCAASPEQQPVLARGDSLLEAMLGEGTRAQDRFSLIADLSEAQLLRVVRGEELSRPVEQLAPEQQRAVQELLRTARTGAANRTGNGSVTIRRFMSFLMLDLGNGLGESLIGGIQHINALREATDQDWISPGDSRTIPDLPIPSPEGKPDPEDLRGGAARPGDLLVRLGRAARWNVLLDLELPLESLRGGYPHPTLTGRLPVVLPLLAQACLLQTKVRRSFLLARSDSSGTELRAGAVPWPLRSALRRSAAAQGGYLRPEDWFQLASLSRDQLNELGEEFPDVHQVLLVQALLRLVETMPPTERERTARSQGSGWEDWGAATRRRVGVLLPTGEARRYRLMLRWEMSSKPPAALVYLGPPAAPMAPRRLEFQRWKKPSEPDQRDPQAPTQTLR